MTLAVGSSDGAARQIASLIAGRLATTKGAAFDSRADQTGRDQSALSAVEAEIDGSLGTRLATIAGGEDQVAEAAMLISAAGRLDHLIYHRRMMLASTTLADPEAGLAELFAGVGGASPGQVEEGCALHRSPA
jgi:hypothetical protein